MNATSSRGIQCFGPFRLDLETGELWKSGTKIRLQGQALQILLCLQEEPGRFRSREELRAKLWPDGTFVDFDHSLNVAVNRLRERLGDSAEKPRYVETVPGKGYRFIVPIEATPPPSAAVPVPQVIAGDQTQRMPKRAVGQAAVIAICALLVVVLAWLIRERSLTQNGTPAQPRIESIAVLPLANLSRNGGDDYFAHGVTEELITELARMGTFRVISRTSIMRFKVTARPLPEIGRELKVDALVEGTVRRSGDRVRITVQLLRPSPEQHVWADAFEGDIHDVLSLQRDVAREIARRIENKLALQPVEMRSSNERVNPDAYEDYLRGRYFLARRNAEAMNKAVGYFQKAVQRDPRYAQAYAGLFDGLRALG